MNRICIIGAGATGLLLLLLLRDRPNISIIDPHFDGGDLARRWGAVYSNTPWSKTFNALQAAFPELELTSPLDLQATTPLASIAELLRKASKAPLKSVSQTRGSVTRCAFSTNDRTWTVHVKAGSDTTTVICDTLVLTQGSEPVSYDLPIPSIPLEIAMDVSRLKYYVNPNDTVVVFGTKHSGTLVIKNACDLSANVVALYKSEKPFYFDRDGVYDGIKADAATIADAILAGSIPVNLVKVNNIAKVIRATGAADWVVYSMGFTPRDEIELYVDDVKKSTTAYNDSTGQLLEVPKAWGFGIAYPKRAPDGTHFDVSVAAFLEHMKGQIATILEVNVR
jgi:hypothetical protein